MHPELHRALRALPSVDRLIHLETIDAAGRAFQRDAVSDIVRRHLADARAAILAGSVRTEADIVANVIDELSALAGPAVPTVVNGTGVIVQTNLGRAPVSVETAASMASAATTFVALETDLETGLRGGRGHSIEALLRALTGAERALVVNNNAAAVMLVLNTLALGREVGQWSTLSVVRPA